MNRPRYLAQLHRAFQVHPVVAILGPRQCGKTTLARRFVEAERARLPSVTFFDLEDPTDLAALAQPKLALENLQGLVVLDEIQRVPELFSVVRVLVDRPGRNLRFLILGSASRDLIRQSSETLAGRIQYIELAPFNLEEVGTDALRTLWWRGGFPPAFLAPSDAAAAQWRKAYVATFLERNLPALGIEIPATTLRRFWLMTAHYHGQLVNYSELGRSFGIADTTVRRYLDLLEGTFVLRLLKPWHANLSKRQVKAPKLYFRDSGLLHTLLGCDTGKQLLRHPKLEASWEGFALEEIVRAFRAGSEDVYFWATHAGAELDLLVLHNGKMLGFEVKYAEAPTLTKSLRAAKESLDLDRLFVVYPGDKTFPLAEDVLAMGLAQAVALAGQGGG